MLNRNNLDIAKLASKEGNIMKDKVFCEDCTHIRLATYHAEPKNQWKFAHCAAVVRSGPCVRRADIENEYCSVVNLAGACSLFQVKGEENAAENIA